MHTKKILILEYEDLVNMIEDKYKVVIAGNFQVSKDNSADMALYCDIEHKEDKE